MATKDEKDIKPEINTKASEEGEVIEANLDWTKVNKGPQPPFTINVTASSNQQEFILGEIKTDIKYMKKRLDKIELALDEINMRLESIESVFALLERSPKIGKYIREVQNMRIKKKS